MADLNYLEKRLSEKFLDMGGGYVLNFSDRTFRDFFGDTVGIDIDQEKYREGGTSKANRLRTFIRLESNYIVGKVFNELFHVKVALEKEQYGTTDHSINQDFLNLCERLKAGGIVENIDAIKATTDDRDFHLLAKNIRESIEKNEPEAALDRLHTFVTRFIRELCTNHGVNVSKDESLNAIFGKYVKFIIAEKMIDSAMSEKILRYSFAVIDAFNDIRNNKSFAHDNPILNYQESILIFSNVAASIKFIQSIEDKFKDADEVEVCVPDLPF
ncbi:abortive infection family protein [Pedobacter sp. UC225_61]|uniref:abortive infection family protein n=1 Tax=Pedobacter sp. UC225_61 TaxID=3374623 RepID=UPI0037BAE6DF